MNHSGMVFASCSIITFTFDLFTLTAVHKYGSDESTGKCP